MTTIVPIDGWSQIKVHIPTNGHRFTALGLPCTVTHPSTITEVDVA